MTPQERAAIEQVSSRQLSWRPAADPRFVELLAGPCPLLNEDGTCSVYAVRPFNCRRYLCFREDGEDWQTATPVALIVDRDAKRQYALNQRHAQRWARSHGWPS